MEKLYIKMKHSGIVNIAGGVCAVIIGVTILISGILLLKNKKEILF